MASGGAEDEADTITISGRGGESKLIVLTEETVLERITSEDMEVADRLIAIAAPEDQGRVTARATKVLAEGKQ